MAAVPSLEPGVPRVGYAIGRGVGPAVSRNRLRRRLRHAMAGLGDHLDPDRAYLIGAAKGATTLTHSDLASILGFLAGELAKDAA
jgi:ribonuclease P protein component